MRVTSEDGRWAFDGTNIVSVDGGAKVEPFAVDFFRCWTFARFLGTARERPALALAWESSQPFDPIHGSYGRPYSGVQVVARNEGSGEWDLVAFELDDLWRAGELVPEDVVWHPRGVLGSLRDEEIWVQVLRAPRGTILPELLPTADSMAGTLAFRFSANGAWRSLALDSTGRFLRAEGPEGAEVFDLEQRRRNADGVTWTPIELWD